ncbi:MAG: DUF2510 domain-containing protein, partial [Demequina sp.]
MDDNDNAPGAGWHPNPENPHELRYWNGNEWTEATAPLNSEKKGTSAGKVVLWILGGGALLLVVVVILAIVGAVMAGDDEPVAAPTEASATPAVSATPTPDPSPEPEPEPEPEPTLDTVSFDGNGDDVIDHEVTGPAIVTFDCPACERNVILETNGPDSLLVNHIGSYSGERIINVSDGDVTTRFTISSSGSWTLTIADLATAEVFDGAAAGSGDRAIFMADTFEVVNVTYEGESNFVVYGYGGDSFSPLVINEIGSYNGTVEMTGPAFVQVISEGDWSITPR